MSFFNTSNNCGNLTRYASKISAFELLPFSNAHTWDGEVLAISAISRSGIKLMIRCLRQRATTVSNISKKGTIARPLVTPFSANDLNIGNVVSSLGFAFLQFDFNAAALG